MTETLEILDIIRFVTGILILFYASYTDIRTRHAYDILWYLMALIACILLIVQYYTVGFKNPTYLIFIPVMIGFAYLISRMRLRFGFADVMALMAIAILVPLEPSFAGFPISKGSYMPFSWSIFQNSLIIFCLIPISLFIYNIIKGNRQLPYSFLGYKMDLKKARNKFVWPLEKLVDGKRKLVFLQKEFDSNAEYDIFEKNGIHEIWVEPKVPFMIPLLIGFIISFMFGDILFYLINSFI